MSFVLSTLSTEVSYVLIVLFVLQQILAMKRQGELVESMEKRSRVLRGFCAGLLFIVVAVGSVQFAVFL